MITINRDSHTIQVTKGAYKQIYKPLGWIVVEEESSIEKETVFIEDANIPDGTKSEDLPIDLESENDSEEDEDTSAEEDEELLEKPLSSMNLKELYRYAELVGVPLESGLSKSSAREAIKNAL